MRIAKQEFRPGIRSNKNAGRKAPVSARRGTAPTTIDFEGVCASGVICGRKFLAHFGQRQFRPEQF
jgi:hypothetical protein